MWSPPASPPPSSSYVYLEPVTKHGIPARYRYLKPDQSFMTPSIRPEYVFEASPLDSRLNAEEQYTANSTPTFLRSSCRAHSQIKGSLSPNQSKRQLKVYVWDRAKPYWRYIGTIASASRDDEKDKQTEAENETQRSAAADIDTKVN